MSTGDIVGSTHIATKWREPLLNDIHDTITELTKIDSSLRIEFYREGSFQIVSGNPPRDSQNCHSFTAHALSAAPRRNAILGRSPVDSGTGEIASSPQNISLPTGKLSSSQEEAWTKSANRLQIKTKWETVNEELKVKHIVCRRHYFRHRCPTQSAVYYALLNRAATQRNRAANQGVHIKM